MQTALASRPNDPDLHVELANILACLGEKQEAIKEADLAVGLLPVSKDAFHGPDILTSAAQAYALAGEKARALQTLEKLLSIPSLVTAEILKLNPIWDSLRDDPAFQQLLARHARPA